MSEYQYVEFVAIDAPVSEKNLEYMHRQSSRAEITNWSFSNEYNYSEFRGNALEMLRRGYDMHLQYANYGVRNLLIRFPAGLPDPGAFQFYQVADSLEFIKDPKGPGGSLSISPYFDGGDLDYLMDITSFLRRMIPLRKGLLEGDLRPLYLAHLAVSMDSNHHPEESREAPVPAGLAELTDAHLALAEFLGLDGPVIEAAAVESAALSGSADEQAKRQEEWIRQQSDDLKNSWLAKLMNDPAAGVRTEVLTKFRAEVDLPAWPTSNPGRTIQQLSDLARDIAEKEKKRAAARREQERQKRLAQMAADPEKVFLEAQQLASERSTSGHRDAVKLLVELREALAKVGKGGIAEKQALKLKNDNPSRKTLHKELQAAGLLMK